MKMCLPFAGGGGGSTVHQFVMLGLEGAGKTTFFFRLKFGNKWKDLTKDLKGDADHSVCPGYMYDEVDTASQMGSVGIWDVPGNSSMIELWPQFYRYVSVVAIFFVVDGGFDLLREEDGEGRDEDAKAVRKNLEELDKARELIHRLLYEDELRLSAFVLLINDKRDPKQERLDGKDEKLKAAREKKKEDCENCVKEVLGVKEASKNEKFMCKTMNLSQFSTDDSEWGKIMNFVRTVYVESGRDSSA